MTLLGSRVHIYQLDQESMIYMCQTLQLIAQKCYKKQTPKLIFTGVSSETIAIWMFVGEDSAAIFTRSLVTSLFIR